MALIPGALISIGSRDGKFGPYKNFVRPLPSLFLMFMVRGIHTRNCHCSRHHMKLPYPYVELLIPNPTPGLPFRARSLKWIFLSSCSRAVIRTAPSELPARIRNPCSLKHWAAMAGHMQACKSITRRSQGCRHGGITPMFLGFVRAELSVRRHNGQCRILSFTGVSTTSLRGGGSRVCVPDSMGAQPGAKFRYWIPR